MKITTLGELDAFLKRGGFDLLVVARGRTTTAVLRRLPPERSYVGRGPDLARALADALSRASPAYLGTT